jgi:quercetin dioxygenase-like cupin family protein
MPPWPLGTLGRYGSLVVRAGEVIENPAGPMRLRFVRTAADTDGELLEMEATYQPGSTEPLEHLHPHQDERFEVVSGSVRARVAGEERTLAAGETLDIPRRTVHAMWNDGDTEAQVIWQTRPALRTEDFMVTTARLAREGRLTAKGVGNPLLGAALMQQFRDEFRPTSPPPALQAIAFPLLAGVGRMLGQGP